MPDILLVDDEENLTYSMKLALERAGYQTRVADCAEAALTHCRTQTPDVAVVDIQLPDLNGLDLIDRLQAGGFDVPVIVITAFGSVARAVEAMKRGAVDFLQKPLSMEEVRLAVDRCLQNRRMRERLEAYRHAQQHESGRIEIIGQSPQIRQVMTTADKIASIPSEPGGGLIATLLLGETGTGKEVLARYLHHKSPRADRPFVHVNCTAIPETLFESELFGYEKGTFTDAKDAKKGLFEIAHEGTLFLDELGDMPAAIQGKFLVAIESGRFRRLGATTEKTVDVRVIAATNANLDQKVRDGEFRADLYYRLQTFCITLPPLRARGTDLQRLTEHFVRKFARKFHKPVPALTPDALRVLQRYGWPGNVRELANVLQRAVLLSDAPTLDAESLGLNRRQTAHAGPESTGGTYFDFVGSDCRWNTIERQLLQAALDAANGNVSEAARLLGLTRGGLRHRMQKQGLSGRS